MHTQYAQFHEKQAEILALAYQDVGRAATMDGLVMAEFPILADADHAVADAYGVFNLLGDSVATPSVFIIDPSGQIVWTYVGKDAGDRPSVAEIVAHLP